MSDWIDVEKDAISFSHDGSEMHIHIENDYSGARYVSVRVADVREMMKKHNI